MLLKCDSKACWFSETAAGPAFARPGIVDHQSSQNIDVMFGVELEGWALGCDGLDNTLMRFYHTLSREVGGYAASSCFRFGGGEVCTKAHAGHEHRVHVGSTCPHVVLFTSSWLLRHAILSATHSWMVVLQHMCGSWKGLVHGS